MSTIHTYHAQITWTGNKGSGTADYKSYERSHTIAIQNKTDILGSSDPAFRGDASRHNPEDLFLSAISSCHMLWYLHLCAIAGINVVSYEDHAVGTMEETNNGGGKFTNVTLHPTVIVTDAYMIEKENVLHHEANKMCFIANSCNFPILHKPFTRC